MNMIANLRSTVNVISQVMAFSPIGLCFTKNILILASALEDSNEKTVYPPTVDQSYPESVGSQIASDRTDKEVVQDAPFGDILPEPASKLSMKAQNRYLKAKVRVLQEELQKMNTELNDSREETARYKKRTQELEDERNRLHRVTTSHSAQVEKVKKSLDETRTHCDTLEAERNALRKVKMNLYEIIFAVYIYLLNLPFPLMLDLYDFSRPWLVYKRIYRDCTLTPLDGLPASMVLRAVQDGSS
ncbi:unnamed protein product [Echinostoma caproni]|uniref:TACC_C domain-containing protein n=1 Tax=Echinostoma caproni TaxID=27848 RepID=A0A183BC55_9TREM|nr:unnamed protein product [Echinostoma caproni]